MLSIHVYRWVVKNGGATTLAEQAVLLNLADHAGDDGRDAFPSVPTIAREIKASEDTVRRALKRLLKNGCIRHDGWRGSTSKQTKNYTVVVPWTPSHPAGGGSVRGDTESGPPLAACGPTPRTLHPEPSVNHHGSAAERAHARASAPPTPSLTDVEQVLRDALPHLPEGRLRINRSKLAKVLRELPATAEEHVQAAHFVVGRAFETPTPAPNGQTWPLHADRLLWSYLRNQRQTQLDFEHEASQ